MHNLLRVNNAQSDLNVPLDLVNVVVLYHKLPVQPLGNVVVTKEKELDVLHVFHPMDPVSSVDQVTN